MRPLPSNLFSKGFSQHFQSSTIAKVNFSLEKNLHLFSFGSETSKFTEKSQISNLGLWTQSTVLGKDNAK